MRKHRLCTRNENGDMFIDFCAQNELIVGGTLFPHKTYHKLTWVSPGGRASNQTDHTVISRK